MKGGFEKDGDEKRTDRNDKREQRVSVCESEGRRVNDSGAI